MLLCFSRNEGKKFYSILDHVKEGKTAPYFEGDKIGGRFLKADTHVSRVLYNSNRAEDII